MYASVSACVGVCVWVVEVLHEFAVNIPMDSIRFCSHRHSQVDVQRTQITQQLSNSNSNQTGIFDRCTVWLEVEWDCVLHVIIWCVHLNYAYNKNKTIYRKCLVVVVAAAAAKLGSSRNLLWCVVVCRCLVLALADVCVYRWILSFSFRGDSVDGNRYFASGAYLCTILLIHCSHLCCQTLE